MKFLRGKDYPWLCEECQAAIDSFAGVLTEGPDTDDDEAPCNYLFDHALFCEGRECKKSRGLREAEEAKRVMPDVVMVPLAYDSEENYEGRLLSAEDCPAGCHVVLEARTY